MCKGSSTVRWLPHFLVSAAAGPACALSWWRWILTLDAFGQSLTDWIWLVQAQWQINCTWSVAETIIRPGESGLDSARLSSTDLASVNDDNDANQIWHDHDMIWHDQLVQLKVHRLCCSHLGNTLLTSLDISWHLTSLDPQEPLDVVEMFDAWNGKPLGSLDDRHPSTSTNTSWTLESLCSDVQRWTFVEPRWITCPGMLARRAGPVETKWDEHLTNIYENHEHLTLHYKLQ